MGRAAEHDLTPLLKPQSIALIGASRRRNSVGNDMIRNLVPAGFKGRVYGVNPSYDTLYGWPCFPHIGDLPEAVDLAIVAVPNKVLEQVVQDAIAAGARALVIFASAELEEETGDHRLRDRVAAHARAAGIPVCGANCMGFFNPIHGLRAFTAFHPEPIATGGLSYIAQSGSLLQALLFNDERLQFNLAVSTGQELVTSAADYLDYALEQPETKVVALVLEAIRDPEKFVAALEKANERNIPVVVLKLGRTEAGAQFALSHTGAIAGDAAIYEALFRRYGVISVRDLNELAATALLLCCDKPLAQGGISAVLDSGGERELIVDVASDEGVPFAEISSATKDVIASNLDAGLTAENPVDAWGTGRDFEAVFENCLLALMRDEDTALGMFVADLSEELDLHAGYVEVCQSVARATQKPLVVMTNYSAWSHRKHAIRLTRSGIVVLDGTVSSLRALKHAMTYRDFKAQKAIRPPAHQENPRAAYWRDLLSAQSGPLTEDQGYRLLSDYAIPVPAFAIVESAEDLEAALQVTGFPLVAKTAEPGILHKSDVGGVILNIATAEEAAEAYADLAARLGPRVLLTAMVSGDVEMAFGLVQDPQFGSFVMIASGGVWIEILKDSQLAKAPVDADEAARRIADLKMAKVLDGVRGADPCDVPALIDAYIKLGALAADLSDWISEIDINPVLVSPHGVVAVDSLIVPANCQSDAAQIEMAHVAE
ncbi:MAG: acetate--CoA ligase family protein [Mangrovicoccus sp.]|nr:acetate--CoA ligase family protein [Mangrovicoccus sp.]